MCEVIHPLALGKLHLQDRTGERRARAKDLTERFYETTVCAGQMSIDEARSFMLHDECGRSNHSESRTVR